MNFGSGLFMADMLNPSVCKFDGDNTVFKGLMTRAIGDAIDMFSKSALSSDEC